MTTAPIPAGAATAHLPFFAPRLVIGDALTRRKMQRLLQGDLFSGPVRTLTCMKTNSISLLIGAIGALLALHLSPAIVLATLIVILVIVALNQAEPPGP